MLVALVVAFSGISDLMARGRSGGGGFRSSSSRSSFKSRSPKRSSTSRSTPKKATVKKASTKKTVSGTSKRSTAAPKRTPAQQKSFETASKNGTVFKSKSAAQSAFKQKNATKYTSKYASKPATRPSHVPATTQVGGRSVNINYNSGMGGYGYTNSLGAFIMYDMMSDAMMMNRMMTQSNYVVNTPRIAPARTVVVHRTAGSVLVTVLCWIFGIAILLAVLKGLGVFS